MSKQFKFDLSPDEAIAEMKQQLEKMRNEKDRDQLKDLTADEAYEIGYETAIYDYEMLRGPDPREVRFVTFDIPTSTEGETND